MNNSFIAKRSFCILSGLSGIVGVVLLMVSFGIAIPPPVGATRAEMVQFGQQHYAGVLWGAWLQAVGPVFIVLFAFSLVHLAGATQRLAGWMTLFGATVLMTVSLIEITYYIGALFPDPEEMTLISLKVISAVQHLYFIVAAPALFLPLGHCSCHFPNTPAIVWLSGTLISSHFRSPRGCFSADSHVAGGCHSVCWSPGALVVGRQHHSCRSQRKNLA